jgi:16S rRNA (adenine1518-N6/adenine1519-N6)-dimethyltransferase
MSLLGAGEIRELAAKLDLKPSKSLGQNFVHDGNVCRKIVRTAGVTSTDIALEIGPGLGSLTLAMLEEAQSVIAVEIDSRLAGQLPITVAAHTDRAHLLTVINEDALTLKALPADPTVLVANLPYNVSVPVFLHLLEILPSLRSGVVMVQAEGSVSRNIFWPQPNVDSKLVAFTRRATPGDEELRKKVFAIIDLAFAQRRKMLRSALSSMYGGSAAAEAVLTEAGIDPTLRGESLDIHGFCAIAKLG